MIYHLAQFAYILASALFVFSLYWMNSPKTARKSVIAGVAAMVLAIVGTMVNPGISNWHWIALAVILGCLHMFHDRRARQPDVPFGVAPPE